MTVSEFVKQQSAKLARESAMAEVWEVVRDCEELERVIDLSILAGRQGAR